MAAIVTAATDCAATVMKRSITEFLTSPSKVAHALDWRKVSGSILSMNINQDRIDLAVGSHPSFADPTITLPSIPMKTRSEHNVKVLDQAVIDEISKLVSDWHVSGLVVSWPVEADGRCGAPCGRVLHALDQMAMQDAKFLNRPICLWDGEHNYCKDDEWGRAAIYGRPSKESVHFASKEQYRDHSAVAADIWNDFCRAHWPEIYAQSRTGKAFSWSTGKPNTSLSSRVDLSWLQSTDDYSYNKALL